MKSPSCRRCRVDHGDPEGSPYDWRDITMFDKLTALEAKYEQMMAEMADPAVQADTAKFRAHSKALSDMQPLVDAFREYKTVVADLAAAEEMLKDPDMQ